jgi:valyl-tRNA synthetase
MNVENVSIEEKLPQGLAIEDKWIISSFNALVREVSENLEKFELGLAAAKLYDFIWDKFCDWYIEFAKTRIQSGNSADEARTILIWVMKNVLKLLHPFMPFITEEIFSALSPSEAALIIEEYPKFSKELCFPEAQDEMEKIMEAIRAVRNRRAEMNIPPSKKTKIYIKTDMAKSFKACEIFFKKLAYGTDVIIEGDFDLSGTLAIVTAKAKIYIPLAELVDAEEEKLRLKKQLEKCEKQLISLQVQLKNEGFLSRAPQKVVEGVKASANQLEEQIKKLHSEIENFK